MKTLNLLRLCCAGGLFLTATIAGAQTTWNYFISDVGGGNSLVTWSVTGTLATPPGDLLVIDESPLPISIVAQGIYASSYSTDFTAGIPNLDGSYYAFGIAYDLIDQYSVNTAVFNGYQSFALAASLPPKAAGELLVYTPGTQSVVLPIAFSDFNPGTYSSMESLFSNPMTVNLTVEPAPEPSSWALAVGAGLSTVLMARRRSAKPV